MLYIRSGVELEVIFTPSSSQLSLLPETDQRVVFPLWGKKEFTIKEKGKPFIENTTVSPSYNYSAEQISRKYERIFSHRKDEIVEILKEFDDKVLDVRIAAKNKINIYHQDYHQYTGLVPLPLLLAHTKSAPYPQILLAKQIGLL